ncbi:MAG: carbamoyltransferase HypF [Myxococcota bacterium]
MIDGHLIRVRGRVQGVGFRPTVARVARGLGLTGFVRNDTEGVLIGLAEDSERCERFLSELRRALPPLAEVDSIERASGRLDAMEPGAFVIHASVDGEVATEIAPDAAMCPACESEILDPMGRRYRYPFTNCTHCGPRYSIVRELPYDREGTTMAGFPMCDACRAEYNDASDRRFHAQPNACFSCGPRAWLERADGRAFSFESYSMMDPVDAVGTLLLKGEIVAIKGLGGFHLCCDATNPDAVAKLRERKSRPHKPLAMMVRDDATLGAYAHVSPGELDVLSGAAAPIVLLEPRVDASPTIAANVAPDQSRFGFMIAYTPLHRLVLHRVSRPVVCTSGNVSDEPLCIDNEDAKDRLSAIADWFLFHDRPIHNVVEDSLVATFVGKPRVMRRGRGFTPGEIKMPPGLRDAPPLLALGAQKKSTFALSHGGRVVMSGHLGELDHPRTFDAWQQALDRFSSLYRHRPQAIVVDSHPGYRATELGRSMARARGLPLTEVQHHHAHIAACMMEHELPDDGTEVLGIALDGLGAGANGELWGGEFLRATYADFERVGTFKPVAMLGGDQASREPWRNLYAHLRAEMSWPELEAHFGDVEVVRRLRRKPCATLDSMLEHGEHAPLCSSGGRLFDAVAAALDLCFEGVSFEAQAAMCLEHAADVERWDNVGELYPIGLPKLPTGLPYVEWLGMWRAILGDLWAGEDRTMIATRFHRSLVDAICRLAIQLCSQHAIRTVVLGGGCWQNRILIEAVVSGLESKSYTVLVPGSIPANDGGISAGQIVVAAARQQRKGAEPCA